MGTRSLHREARLHDPDALLPRRWVLVVMAVLGLSLGLAVAAESATFAERVARAHGVARWSAKRAVEMDFEMQFGPQRWSGKLLYEVGSGRGRAEAAGGTVTGFDGRDAWVAPADAPPQNARFMVPTWWYFLAVPFKLADPGTHLVPEAERQLAGATYATARLTFAPGTGDSPDDWYILYAEPDSGRLKAMAYIVTYGGVSPEKAEQEPHAIVYDRFETVDGVTLSTSWSFYNWNQTQGVTGEPIGGVTIRGLRFVDAAADAFTRPAGARIEN